MTVTGSCLCGAIRFTYHGEIGFAAICHCSDCRKCTGSAFNVSIGVEVALLSLSGNSLKNFTKKADSGHNITRHFCANCGSPIFTSSSVHPDRYYVKAGVFDDPDVVKPAYQSWLRSKVSWAEIPPCLPAHEKKRTP